VTKKEVIEKIGEIDSGLDRAIGTVKTLLEDLKDLYREVENLSSETDEIDDDDDEEDDE